MKILAKSLRKFDQCFIVLIALCLFNAAIAENNQQNQSFNNGSPERDDPELAIDIIELEEEILPGSIQDRVIVFSNIGDEPLEFEITDRLINEDQPNIGELIREYEVPGQIWHDLTWDGEFIWGTYQEEFGQYILFAFNPLTAEIEREFQIHFNPNRMTFDGQNLWINQWNEEAVLIYDRDGNVLDLIEFEDNHINIYGMASDKENFVILSLGFNLKLYSIQDRVEIHDIYLGPGGMGFRGFAMEWVTDHDGVNLWMYATRNNPDEGRREGLYRFNIDENMNLQFIEEYAEDFNLRSNTGFTHDGRNLWRYRLGTNILEVYDDGILENYWFDFSPREGILNEGEATNCPVIYHRIEIEDLNVNGLELVELPREGFGFHNLPPEELEERDLNVAFRAGWNLVSVNISPPVAMYAEGEDRGPDVILMTEQMRIDEDNHNIRLLKDEVGQFYSPTWGFNNIPYWDLNQGYFVNVIEETETIWTGEPIPFDADLPIEAGWNIIAYLPTFELSARAPNFPVLAPIIDNVRIAKNSLGQFLSPEFEFSNMVDWREGEGYQINLPIDYQKRIQLKDKRGHKEQELDVTGVSGTIYRLILRQSAFNPLAFSVILAVLPQNSNQPFRLRRYNGKSHEHSNHIEGEKFYDFHIHFSTERYQEFGTREDSFAQPSDRFGNYHGAIQCMIEDCGFDIPQSLQRDLFDKVDHDD